MGTEEGREVYNGRVVSLGHVGSHDISRLTEIVNLVLLSGTEAQQSEDLPLARLASPEARYEVLRLVQLFGEGGQLCLILIEGEVPSKDQYLEARVGWEEVLDLHRKRVGCANEDLRWNSLPHDQIGGEVLVGGVYDDRRIVVDGDAAREATERGEHSAKISLTLALLFKEMR